MGGRTLALAGLLLGLAALAAIVWRVGPASVEHAVSSIGWGFALVLGLRVLIEVATGGCWSVLLPGRPRLLACAWARLIRDSASECLPLSQIGGFVLGARALALTGTEGGLAAASTVVDVTLELFAQLAYLVGGLVLLAHLHPHSALARPLAAGVAVMGAGALCFLLLQSRGAAFVERAATRLGQGWPGAGHGTRAVLAALGRVHANRLRLLVGAAGHLGCWVANGLEAWLILWLIGSRVPVEAALVIDSLLYGLRSFAFMIPNALGVQEAGYVLLGGLFGLPPDIGLALSLLRRARDVALGVPALASWQLAEGRRWWRRRDAVPATSAAADEVT